MIACGKNNDEDPRIGSLEHMAAILNDFNMTGITGQQLIREVLERWPTDKWLQSTWSPPNASSLKPIPAPES